MLFCNVWDTIKSYPENFIYMFIGGRGIGKTYSALKGLLEKDEQFMYVRRTDTELQNCCTEVNNPFLRLNEDLNRHVGLSKTKDFYVIHEDEKQLGVATSLSTFGKFRGSDFSYINYIVFDEFINTSPHNTLKKEDFLFFNLIETVQRNRELIGEKSIKILMLSNANSLDNDIIKTLKVGEIIRLLKNSDVDHYEDVERGLVISLPKTPELSKRKKETKLYKLTQGTDFYDMSIQNDFTTDDFTQVKRISTNMLVPLCQYEKACFYTIKNSEKLYVSYRKNDSPYFSSGELKSFKRQYGMLLGYYLENRLLYYYDYDLVLFVKNIFT